MSLTIIKPAYPDADPRIIGYAEDAAEGRIVVCDKARRICEIFLNDLTRVGDSAFPYTFDAEKASRPIRFTEKFIRPTGDYDRMELMPWQAFILGALFGFVRRDTGQRKHQKALILVGSGNGKTPLVASIALYCASQEGTRNPEIDVFANSREQAGILVGDCAAMVADSRALQSRFKVLKTGLEYYADGWQGRGRIPVPDGAIRNFSADARKLDGLRPTTAIFDEVHEMRTYKLISQMKRSLLKSRDPLMLLISTMGTVLDGVLVSEYRLADERLKGLGDQEVNESFFPFICELDEQDDPSDADTWIKANPSLGVLLDRQALEKDWTAAKRVPALKSDFLTKRLNCFTKVDEASYLDWELVQRNQDEIDLEAIRGREAFGGFDISASGDHTSVCLEVPLADGRFFILPHTFVPRAVAERDAERLPYWEYAMQGDLTIIDGEYVKQEYLIAWFEKWAEVFDIRCIGYDPANATLLVRALSSWRGPTNPVFTCDPVRQGALTLNAPMKDLRERFTDSKIVHNRNRLFEWYLNNVRLRKDYLTRDNENWVPVKMDKYRKIDAFMALLDAHTAWMRRCPIQGAEAAEAGVQFISLG